MSCCLSVRTGEDKSSTEEESVCAHDRDCHKSDTLNASCLDEKPSLEFLSIPSVTFPLFTVRVGLPSLKIGLSQCLGKAIDNN